VERPFRGRARAKGENNVLDFRLIMPSVVMHSRKTSSSAARVFNDDAKVSPHFADA